MQRLTRGVLSLFCSIIKVRRSALSSDIKKKLMATYVKLIILKRYDRINNVADILGHKIKFCTYSTLATLFAEIFISNSYYISNLPQHAYIIDCGSNIGISVLYFKIIYPLSKVLAFEPDEDAFLCLEANIKSNKLTSTIPLNIALTDRESTVDFFYDKHNPGSPLMSLKRERMPRHKKTVRASTLSEYIDRNVDLVKMNIEGSELEVIRELANSGKLHFIKQMIIEYHHHIAKDNDIFSQILYILENAGFGYQIQSSLRPPYKPKRFQDILIYAYQKEPFS
jgi:FkbM family methyltransferase